MVFFPETFLNVKVEELEISNFRQYYYDELIFSHFQTHAKFETAVMS